MSPCHNEGIHRESDDTEPLWHSDDPAARLAELLSNDDDLKVAPLRRDVRLLGMLLGGVIHEQSGASLFNSVETLRGLATRHRDDVSELALMEEAERLVDQVPVPEAYELTRAFAIYFDLTNLAETAHRRRRRRASQHHGDDPPQPGTPAGTLRRLAEAGAGCAISAPANAAQSWTTPWPPRSTASLRACATRVVHFRACPPRPCSRCCTDFLASAW